MQKELEISDKLHKCRDTAKRFYREEYKEKLIPFTDLIETAMKAEKADTLTALLGLLQTEQVQENGMWQMLFCAAAVEMIEAEDAR